MTIEEAHAEENYRRTHSYSPEALAQAVAALDDEHVGDRINIFLAHLCFRRIYFPMLTKARNRFSTAGESNQPILIG